MYHSKPILEIYTQAEKELVFEDKKLLRDYYKTVEKSLTFWQSADDDGIFESKKPFSFLN